MSKMIDKPLCHDCRRGMVYCGDCNEETYLKFHKVIALKSEEAKVND